MIDKSSYNLQHLRVFPAIFHKFDKSTAGPQVTELTPPRMTLKIPIFFYVEKTDSMSVAPV